MLGFEVDFARAQEARPSDIRQRPEVPVVLLLHILPCKYKVLSADTKSYQTFLLKLGAEKYIALHFSSTYDTQFEQNGLNFYGPSCCVVFVTHSHCSCLLPCLSPRAYLHVVGMLRLMSLT